MFVTRICGLEQQPRRTRFQDDSHQLLKRDVVIVRAFVIAPADVHPHPFGRNVGRGGVQRFHVGGGDFLVSTWGGVVYYVTADGTKQVLLDGREQKINSADIGYDAAKRIVYIPTFWKNSVVAYELR